MGLGQHMYQQRIFYLMYYIHICLYSLVRPSHYTPPVPLIFPSLSQSPQGLQQAQNILLVLSISCFCLSPLAYCTAEGALQHRPQVFVVLPLWPCWPLCASFVLVYVWKNPPLSGVLVIFGMFYHPWFLCYGLHPPRVPWSLPWAVL